MVGVKNLLKKLFSEGKYNEALLETNQNDRFLLQLLPLFESDIFPKIEIAILENAILLEIVLISI